MSARSSVKRAFMSERKSLRRALLTSMPTSETVDGTRAAIANPMICGVSMVLWYKFAGNRVGIEHASSPRPAARILEDGPEPRRGRHGGIGRKIVTQGARGEH